MISSRSHKFNIFLLLPPQTAFELFAKSFIKNYKMQFCF